MSYRSFKLSILFWIALSGYKLSAQKAASQSIDDQQIQILEEYIENLEGAEEFDYNTLFENLMFYSRHPLNLNEAGYDDLKELLILNEIQINALLRHRADLGGLFSLHELQSIASFDLKTIRQILPFVTVEESDRDYFVPLQTMLSEGDRELFFKWRRVLEKQKGFISDAAGETPYIGDPNRFYLKFSHQYERKLKFGFTAEKDAGENWFSSPNEYGFDFYSFHFHLRDVNRSLKDFVIGDYSVSLGQGLILHNQFGAGKSSSILNVKRGGRVLKPYTSVNEVNFYRGAAASFYLGEAFEFSVFGSLKKIDGNPVVTDTTGTDSEFQFFSSIIQAGLHRTASEISNEKTVQQFSGGGQLSFRSRSTQISLNALYEGFDRSFERNLQLYNQFQFRGRTLFNTSISYSHQLKNLHFFGETAVSDNGGMAHIHGALIGLNRVADLSVVFRDYGRDYQSINSNSFGETIGTNNEKGIYLGLEIRPHIHWRISAYADAWKHGWLRFGRDAPSIGNEYLIKLQYYKRRELDFYLQYKIEQKQENTSSQTDKFDVLEDPILQRLRIHVAYKVHPDWELRNRLEYSFYTTDAKNSRGFLIYQDVIFNSIQSPFSFSARLAYFDTNDFDSRIYAFENDLIYEYFIPFYQYRGIRTYLNCRYDNGYSITAEFRISRTYLENREFIGSGNDIIEGVQKTEIKAQMRFKF